MSKNFMPPPSPSPSTHAPTSTCEQVEADAGFGQRTSVDLLPSGSSIHVATANVAQYCELHARHLLVHAIHKQFAAFQRGFLRLCSGAALQLFR
jgi:hypothetical protein